MKSRMAIAVLVASLCAIPALASPANAKTDKKEKKAELKALRHDPAYRKGYDDGYGAGGRDSQANSTAYNDQGGKVFEQADDGYTPEYGDKAKYEKLFRMGYVAGYKAGWDFNAGRFAPFGPSK